MEISALQGKNLTDLCRCCLTTSNYMTKFSAEDEKAIMLSSILNFEVEIDENTPQSICECCVRLLETSYDFQQLLKKSTKLIQAVVLNQHVKEDDSTDSALMEFEETESKLTNPIEFVDPDDVDYFDESEDESPSKSQKSHMSLSKVKQNPVQKTIKKSIDESNNKACVQCDFVTSNERALRMHMKFRHKDLRLRWCSACNILVDNLIEHTVKNHQSEELRCELCKKICLSRSGLTEHLRWHSRKQPHKCHLCGKSFITIKYLRAHLVKIHRDIPHERDKEDEIDRSLVEEAIKKIHEVFTNNKECVQCDFVGDNVCALSMHMRFRHKELNLRWCSTCNTLVDDLTEHTVKNHQSDPLTCQFCQKSFLTRFRLKGHLRTHLNQKPYKCHLCEGNFARGQTLKRHLIRIHGDKSFESNLCHKCENCNIAYYNVQALEEHIKSHVVDENTPLVARNFCNFCQKEVSDPSVHYQQYHLKTPKEHSCAICGQTFKRARTLRLHMRKHTGNFPYSCKFCPKKGTTREQIRDHERTHTGEKPYKCTYCDAAFYRSNPLLAHIRLHTGKTFKCDICKKAYLTQARLRVHMRQHSGQKSIERPYLCSICGNGFKQKNHLQKHESSHQKASLKKHIK